MLGNASLTRQMWSFVHVPYPRLCSWYERSLSVIVGAQAQMLQEGTRTHPLWLLWYTTRAQRSGVDYATVDVHILDVGLLMLFVDLPDLIWWFRMSVECIRRHGFQPALEVIWYPVRLCSLHSYLWNI